jgi:exopolysaccharide production protein ExoZ
MTNEKHLASIHALRSIAPFLMIIFHSFVLLQQKADYHFSFLDHLSRSGGVDFFFVLTGFLTYYIYHNKITNVADALGFIRKKLLRIYPLYWVVLLTVLPVIALIPSLGSEGDRTIIKLIKTIFLLSTEPIIAVAWSLTFTLFFYFVFAVARLLPKRIAIVLLTLWVVAIIIVNDGFLLNYYHLDLMIGVLVGNTLRRMRAKKPLWLVTIGVCLFILTWCNFIFNWLTFNPIIFYSTASACLIYGVVSLDLMKEIRIPKVIRKLGDASFAIFLTHSITISSILTIVTRLKIPLWNTFPMIILFVSICAIVGLLLHSLVEKPLVTLLNSSRNRTIMKANRRKKNVDHYVRHP